MKKILLASLFLGGGYYFIKKILPNLKSNKEFEVDTKDYEDELAKLESDRLAFIEYQKTIGQRNKDGSYNENWWLNTNIKIDKEALKNIEQNLNEYYNQN